LAAIAGGGGAAVVALLCVFLRYRKNRVAPVTPDSAAEISVQQKYLDAADKVLVGPGGDEPADMADKPPMDTSPAEADGDFERELLLLSSQTEGAPLPPPAIEGAIRTGRFQDLGPLPRQGGLHTLHKALITATGTEVAAKRFDNVAAFNV
jgi:hypothetical protein